MSVSTRSTHVGRVVCLSLAVFGGVSAAPARGDDWPQWLGPQRDGVWRESGLIERFPAAGPDIRWRTPVGQGYAGPAIAAGRVFVTDRILAEGVKNPDNAFSKEKVAGRERVLCLDEPTGKVVWKHEYPCDYRVSYASGPRTTPIVRAGRVYTLGTMGDLLCLDAASGTVIWSRNFPAEFAAEVPLWGWAASPVLDGDRLICLVGGAGSVAVAFNKDTGKEVWRALTAKEPGYCPPVIVTAGGVRQLIIWHPEAVCSLNPETGAVYWTQPFAIKAGLSIPTPRASGDELFVTSFYNGSMMLRLDRTAPKATVVWKGKSQSEQHRLTDGLHAIMSTPVFKGDTVYGVCSYGELRGLRAADGGRLWENLQATGGKLERWGNAFIVEQADRYFLFNEHGDLIIASMSPSGYKELSRAHLIDPTNTMAGRPVVWVHPAFANRSVYVRNDKEILKASLAAE